MKPFKNTVSLPAVFDGKITKDSLGWEFISAEESSVTFNPFEGFYPNKGGKLFSPYLELDKKTDEAAYYRLSFTAETPEMAFEAIFFYDASGNELPDNYDVLYSGEKREYDRIVYATEKAAYIRVLLQSAHGLDVENLKVERAYEADATEYCDRLYGTLPQLSFTAPKDAMALLPRTSKALHDGTPWRVIMLGDSIINDGFHSLFPALIKRDFPNSNFTWASSVRGSTGCWYYSRIDAFKQYVIDKKPDLLIIGGISNYNYQKTGEFLTGTEAIAAVAKAAHELCGCEVLLLTSTLSMDTRHFDAQNPKSPLPEQTWNLEQDFRMSATADLSGLFAAAKELNIAAWDILTPAYTWLYQSGMPHEFFSRDWVHSGELGKQIIGRLISSCFKAAAE